MKEKYAQVIDALVGNCDYKAIALALAKNRPDLFIKYLPSNNIEDKIARIYESQSKIAAIREYCGLTNTSLVESKAWVEDLAIRRNLIRKTIA